MKALYLSLPKAAALFGYSVDTLRGLIRRGQLKTYILAGCSHPRVKVADVEALYHEVPAVGPGPVDSAAVWRQLAGEEWHQRSERQRRAWREKKAREGGTLH